MELLQYLGTGVFLNSDLLLFIARMESQAFEKQMFSTNRKDKIFNVRKMPYKHFENQKYLKSNFSPFQKKEFPREPASSNDGVHPAQPKKGDFMGLPVGSAAYKQLNKKFQALKEECGSQKQRKLQVSNSLMLLQKLKQREEELDRYKTENDRLGVEKQKLLQRRDEIKNRIEELRERNEVMRQQQMVRNEEIRQMNMEYLRNMVIAMRYQNGLQIDTDNMTYQQLLQLEEKMGSVSKGLTEAQMSLIRKLEAKGVEDVCSICYENIKDGEQLMQLPCLHYFHTQQIQEWLKKQKICPLCKQEIAQPNPESNVPLTHTQ